MDVSHSRLLLTFVLPNFLHSYHTSNCQYIFKTSLNECDESLHIISVCDLVLHITYLCVLLQAVYIFPLLLCAVWMTD